MTQFRGAAPLLADFALKLVLNAVSTGANVIKGAVYGNSMINLTGLFLHVVD